MSKYRGYPLERRTCVCGCGRSFRVMPTSKQLHASIYCPRENAPRRSWGHQGFDLRSHQPDGLLTATALAAALGLGLSTIYAWAKSGKIPAEKGKGCRGPKFNLARVKTILAESPDFN